MSDTPAPAKSGKSPLVLILAAVVALSLGAGGAFWYTRRAAPAGEAPARAHTAEHGLLSLEPFVVNLADPNGTRFLRTTVHLVVRDETEVERLKKTPVALMQARGAILELLTAQTADKLVTADGKSALKKAIADCAVEALDGTKVTDVLFSDFVVQF